MMNIATIVLYELKLMLRNRVNLILLLVLPVMMIALMGYAMKPLLNMDTKAPQSSFTGALSAVPENNQASAFVNIIELKKPETRTLGSFQFFGAGMLIFFLLTCGMGLGMNIINERSDRVFFRIISFPVTHNQYLMGKAIGNALIGFFQAASVILFTSLILKVDWGSNYIGLFLVVAELMLLTSGITIIFSNLLNSAKTLSTLLTVFFWMMAFISGSFAPLPIFEPIAGYTINKWAFEALAGFMTGKGIMEVLNYLILLLAAGLVLWVAGVMLYSRRISNE